MKVSVDSHLEGEFVVTLLDANLHYLGHFLGTLAEIDPIHWVGVQTWLWSSREGRWRWPPRRGLFVVMLFDTNLHNFQKVPKSTFMADNEQAPSRWPPPLTFMTAPQLSLSDRFFPVTCLFFRHVCSTDMLVPHTCVFHRHICSKYIFFFHRHVYLTEILSVKRVRNKQTNF